MNGRGIDYSGPMADGRMPNRDLETGIRYGIIPLNSLGEFAHDSFEAVFLAYCPNCEQEIEGGELTVVTKDDEEVEACPHCGFAINNPDEIWGDEPAEWVMQEEDYEGFLDEAGDVWFTKSPFVTRASFCSPCAPGACYITSQTEEGEWCYCPGPEWFEADNTIGPIPFAYWPVEEATK